MSIVSYSSFLSFFVYPSGVAECHALMLESKPTRCGHTLRGGHFRGLASDCAPSNPAKAERREQ